MRWLYKIELNAAIRANDEEFDLSRHEEPCPPAALERLAAEVEKAQPIAHIAPAIREAKSIAEVNRLLAEVYDVADRRSVWCGM